MQKNVTTQEIADNKLAIILILKNGELLSFIKNRGSCFSKKIFRKS